MIRAWAFRTGAVDGTYGDVLKQGRPQSSLSSLTLEELME